MGRSPKAATPTWTVQPFTDLQQRWTTLWTTTLPKLASSHSPVQGNGEWPVTVDHSFARIILDNVVGTDKPWAQAVSPPATVNMTEKQLEECISLAERIASGDVDLSVLQEKSLKLRGLAANKKPTTVQGTKKRKRAESSNGNILTAPKLEEPPVSSKKSRKQEAADGWETFSLVKRGTCVNEEEAEMVPDIQHIILQSPLKPFQQEALILLSQVPRGRYTTYQAISNAMRKQQGQTQTSHQASGHARAVGMAMRSNPYAPTVPCHRMLSSSGRIGGFHGDWEHEGGFYSQKMRLLVEEGVEFDEKCKAVGEPFTDFH